MALEWNFHVRSHLGNKQTKYIKIDPSLPFFFLLKIPMRWEAYCCYDPIKASSSIESETFFFIYLYIYILFLFSIQWTQKNWRFLISHDGEPRQLHRNFLSCLTIVRHSMNCRISSWKKHLRKSERVFFLYFIKKKEKKLRHSLGFAIKFNLVPHKLSSSWDWIESIIDR